MLTISFHSKLTFFLPLDFSFWVAANMPLDDNLRLQILSINCPTQRLRRELEIVRKVINTVKVITGLHTENSPDRRNRIDF